MENATHLAARILAQMAPAAKARFATETRWAEAAGLRKETLSRLKKQDTCDLRTLGALAESAGYTLAPVAHGRAEGEHLPAKFTRSYEEDLLDLCASANVDPGAWRAHGPGFFMGGLAVMLASAKGFERERYLRLAEELHPGITTPEVFGMWMQKSPLRAPRFLPMARQRRKGT